MLKTRESWPASDLDYQGPFPVLIQRDLDCEPRCRIQPHHCNPLQVPQYLFIILTKDEELWNRHQSKYVLAEECQAFIKWHAFIYRHGRRGGGERAAERWWGHQERERIRQNENLNNSDEKAKLVNKLDIQFFYFHNGRWSYYTDANS